jgi:eukaryotic-like serine/threonine-protein kinase
VPSPSRWRAGGAGAGAALVVGAGLLGVATWPSADSHSVPGARTFRFDVVPPEGAAFAMSPAFMAVSPDGRMLAWHGPNARGETGIWIRSLDSPVARMLDGARGGVQPFWSPDSRSVAFIAAGKLKRVDVSGGLAQTLADAPASMSGTWNRDGVILITDRDGLIRVSATGASTAPVTMLDPSRGEIGHYWPQFLPDGRHFLYQAKSTQPDYDGVVYVGSLDTPERVTLLSADSQVTYVPQGFLLFMQSTTLVAQPFDRSRLRISGEPRPVAEQLDVNANTRRGAFSVSPAGDDNGIHDHRRVERHRHHAGWNRTHQRQ